MLTKCGNDSAFAWIDSGRMPHPNTPNSAPDWPGITVASVIPPIFPAYAKIFQRIDAHFDWIDNPLSKEECTVLQIPNCSEVEEFVCKRRRKDSATKVRWKEVCDLLQLPFGPSLTDEWFRQRLPVGCWPRYFWGPPDGQLDEEEMIELASLLSAEAYDQDCFMRLPYVPFVGTDEVLLYEGDIKNVSNLRIQNQRPEYWWPGSRKWCVCSDYDLTFTIVGGSRQCIDLILTSDLLETVEISPSTRVDFKTPISAS